MGLGADGLSSGDRAPAFRIATDGGETVSSAGLKGSPYVVYFYPKDDTSGCTKEAIAFSAALPKFRKLGLDVLGVSRDSVESHAKFRKKHKLKLALGPDGVKALATMPSLDEMRAKLIGLIQAPATKLAQLTNAPAGKLARVVQAYADKNAA